MKDAQEKPRLLILDLLESYARERNLYVQLERDREQDQWICVLKSGVNGLAARCVGRTAREAIAKALQHEGVDIPL